MPILETKIVPIFLNLSGLRDLIQKTICQNLEQFCNFVLSIVKIFPDAKQFLTTDFLIEKITPLILTDEKSLEVLALKAKLKINDKIYSDKIAAEIKFYQKYIADLIQNRDSSPVVRKNSKKKDKDSSPVVRKNSKKKDMKEKSDKLSKNKKSIEISLTEFFTKYEISDSNLVQLFKTNFDVDISDIQKRYIKSMNEIETEYHIEQQKHYDWAVQIAIDNLVQDLEKFSSGRIDEKLGIIKRIRLSDELSAILVLISEMEHELYFKFDRNKDFLNLNKFFEKEIIELFPEENFISLLNNYFTDENRKLRVNDKYLFHLEIDEEIKIPISDSVSPEMIDFLIDNLSLET